MGHVIVPASTDKSTETGAAAAAWTRTRCFSTSVRRADRILTRVYDDALRPAGLATTQYSLLSLIDCAPQNISLGDLAEAQAMDRTTLSRNLAPLVRDGYVAIEPGADRRVKTVQITDEGLAGVRQARPLWKAPQERIANEHGLPQMERLHRLLRARLGGDRPSHDHPGGEGIRDRIGGARL